MIIIIDNYDSFTYNLVQYASETDKDIQVYKNDEISIEKIKALNPSHIIISPGPGRPENSRISIAVINELKSDIPILGICLGHQAIGYVFKAEIINSKEIYHGKTSQIFHNEDSIFNDVPSPFDATRYHSLIIKKTSIPDSIDIIATTNDSDVMAIKHREHQLYGLQFHPESILTNYGMKIITNFLDEDKR